jgi:predicted amidohydrolase YtcJ
VQNYGSDFFVSPSYGLTGIQVAMTRRHVKMDPAYQAHLEDITGSIEVGKSAELVVLDSDIENIPVEQIQDVKVLETVFKGKTVFKK